MATRKRKRCCRDREATHKNSRSASSHHPTKYLQSKMYRSPRPHQIRSSLLRCLLFLFLSCGCFLVSTAPAAAAASIRINEVADKGSGAVCNGGDWIELYLSAVGDNEEDDNTTTTTRAAVDLGGYVLHDDNGPADVDAYTFPASTIVNPGDYILLCNGGADVVTSPQFGIGGTDQVSLLDPSGVEVSTTGTLQDRGEFGVSFAYDEEAGTYVYTSTPTPGETNVITLLPEPETVEEMRARLAAQNDMGTEFFNMDAEGKPLVDGSGLDEIVDLRMEMDPGVWDQMYQDRSYEVYSPFTSVTVTVYDDPGEVLLNLTGIGRMRPKGQSTLAYGTCMDRSIPYSIDFDTTDADQTLFGVQRAYLRTHFGDSSFAREWVNHRALARFGLPYLRTRTVRFFVNENVVGLYDLLEAPDQDYVFQRSFPSFDPSSYALYKVKTLSLGCDAYDDGSLRNAEARINETNTPPYAFERGEHRPKIPIIRDWLACSDTFFGNIANEFEDVILAYIRGGNDCGSVLVDEGLIDRDLGSKAIDNNMKDFIDQHLGANGCTDSQCSNSLLVDDIDTDNFLRNYAVMASLLNSDSALGNGNNYYLAYTGENSTGWALVQYDHNGILSGTSAELCDAEQCYDELVKWSILRPTCRVLSNNQMAGPLLTDDALLAKYINYVEEFVGDVMTDEAFLDQIYNHLLAIKDEVAKDDWNDFAFYFESLELSQGDKWLHDIFGTKYVPLLPAMRARSAEINKQLEAISAGTIPRTNDGIDPIEVCVNWEATEARVTICPENCLYEGCFRDDFDVKGFCSPDDGKCYHGMSDIKCDGIPNTQQYIGIARFEDSDKAAFCWFDPTIGPLKLAECPTYIADSDSTSGIDDCPENCQYEGCAIDGFEIAGFCSPDDGICYHGIIDTDCFGIEDTLQYAGMTNFEGSNKRAFCFQDETLGPVKVAECPDFQDSVVQDDGGDDDGSSANTLFIRMLLIVVSFAAVLFTI
mmetsp:Transcript_45226/g.110175  ORF Transcript_45226/g.110175 Transcript_45226/m.110175 type:complete len:983 (+) Transcript_45226:54-3002(+)